MEPQRPLLGSTHLVAGASRRSQSLAIHGLCPRRWTIGQERVPTRLRFRTILARSISAALSHMMRTNLELTATNAQLQGASLHARRFPRLPSQPHSISAPRICVPCSITATIVHTPVDCDPYTAPGCR